MPIVWKKGSRFKPEIVLKRIAATRTKNPEGKGSSFSGWEIDYFLPLLHSMLIFPDAARDADRATLIWKAVANDPGDLTAESFIKELNKQLSGLLSTKETKYFVLTTMSIDSRTKLGNTSIGNVDLRFLGAAYPKKFQDHRSVLIKNEPIPAAESPVGYQKISAVVKSKNPRFALETALRAIDVHRAFWCLLGNSQMEMIGRAWIPINKIVLGPIHTIHGATGRPAEKESLWFEPHQVLPDAYRIDKVQDLRRARHTIFATASDAVSLQRKAHRRAPPLCSSSR